MLCNVFGGQDLGRFTRLQSRQVASKLQSYLTRDNMGTIHVLKQTLYPVNQDF